jgi:hypothetical protein
MPIEITFETAPVDRIAHTKLDRLIGDDEVISDEVRKLVIRVSKLVEPFEEYAATIDWSERRDVIDFYLLMHLEGAFGPSVIENIDRLAKRTMNHLCASSRRLMDRQGGSSSDSERYANRFGRAMIKNVHLQLLRDGRRLAFLCIKEAEFLTGQFNTQANVVNNGLEAYLHYIRQRQSVPVDDPFTYQANWWALVSKTRDDVDPDQIMSEAEFQDAVRVLSETDFTASTESVDIPVPSVFRSLVRPKCRMTIDPMLFANGLAVFFLDWEGHSSINWSISRVDGHCQLMTSLLTSSDFIFEHFEKKRAHDYLMRYCVAALLKALKTGQLREVTYVAGDDFATRLELLQLARQIEAEKDVTCTVPEIGIVPQAVAAMPQSSFLDLSGSMGHGKRTKRFSPWHRPGSLSWRRIMGALKRCGVTIDLTTRHPKLTRNGKTAGFLNRHSEEDLAFNLQVLYKTLDKLEVSLDSFYAAL